MNKFYGDEDYNNSEAYAVGSNVSDNESSEAFDDNGYEEYVPYYDKDDGEYKYVSAATENTEEADADEDGYILPAREPEEEYYQGNFQDENEYNEYNEYREPNDMYYGKDGHYGDFAASNLVSKIDSLNRELNDSNKKTEEEKIRRLNGEINMLKEQLFRINTANDLKNQFETFKKEFLANQKSGGVDENGKRYYGENYYGKKSEKDYINRGREYESEELSDIVEKVKKEFYHDTEFDNEKILKEIEKLNENSVTQLDIIEKVNSAVESKMSGLIDVLVSQIDEKVEQRLADYNNNNLKLIDDVLHSGEDEQTLSDKFDELNGKLATLEENARAQFEEYNGKQNDILIKFAEIAEKIENNNVIDKDDLYNETMLDGIGDIKADVKNTAKDFESFKEEYSTVKEGLAELKSELESLKENFGQILGESAENGLSGVNANIDGIKESLATYTESNQTIVAEIKQSVEEIKQAVTETSSLSEINEAIADKFDLILRKVSTLAVKEDVDQSLADFRQGVLEQNYELESKLKAQLEKALSEIQTDITAIKENSDGGLKEAFDNQIDEIREFLKTTEKTINASEDLSIGMDTLLRQSEDNVAVQSGIGMNIEAINAQISGFAEKVGECTDKLLEVKSSEKEASFNKEALQETVKETVEKLLKSYDDKQKRENEKNVKVIDDKIQNLKRLILATKSGDVKYDLTSIFTEIRKIGEKISGNGGVDDSVEEDSIRMSTGLKELRNQLGKVSEIAESAETTPDKTE